MLVVTPSENVDSLISGVEKSLKGANASDLKVEHLGKKKLAYPISKQTDGEYYLFNFEAPTEAIRTINDKLRLEQEAILRYLIIKSQAAGVARPMRAGEVGKKAVVTVKTKVSKKEASKPKKEKVASAKKQKPKKKVGKK